MKSTGNMSAPAKREGGISLSTFKQMLLTACKHEGACVHPIKREQNEMSCTHPLHPQAQM